MRIESVVAHVQVLSQYLPGVILENRANPAVSTDISGPESNTESSEYETGVLTPSFMIFAICRCLGCASDLESK
jgi:hypothetical protein